MIQLRTIPHTGTRFLQQLLGRMGVAFTHRHIAGPKPIAIDGPTVIALRDPVLARLSFLARNPRSDGMGKWCSVSSWDPVMALAGNGDVHFVKVQEPRADEKGRLSEFCGVEQTEAGWEPVGERATNANRSYLKDGIVPESVVPDVERLLEMGAGVFFASFGYRFPWME